MEVTMKTRTLFIALIAMFVLFAGCSKFSEPKEFDTIQEKKFEQDELIGFRFHFSSYYVRDEGKDDVAYFLAPSLDAIVVGDLEVRNYSRANHSGKFIIKELSSVCL
jgi:hypothetical protein